MNGRGRKDFAMTHEEIASVMGISRTRVYQIELHAIAKLKRKPKALRALRDLASELNRQRKTVIFPDWGGN